jgi:hypothetical protein
MVWTKLGDIERRYNHVTLVAGDLEVVRAWPGNEAAGFPDDEYDLPSGSVAIFDLDLLKPIVFCAPNAVRLLASPDDLGSTNVDDATLAAAVEEPGRDQVAGTFEVEHGAMVVLCADWAGHEVQLAASTEPTLGKGFAVIPCANGRYQVSTASSVKATHGGFDRMVQVTISRAE